MTTRQEGGELVVGDADDLEAALAEQTRLSDMYKRAMGTSAELSSYVQLQGASERVTACHRALRRFDRGFSLSLAGGPEAPRKARKLLAERLGPALDKPELDTLQLLVTEVITNCVRHANADASSWIEFAVSVQPRGVRVAISTDGSPFDHPSTPLPQPDPAKAGGRGLYVLDALSQRWGVEPRDGNKVWFDLATG